MSSFCFSKPIVAEQLWIEAATCTMTDSISHQGFVTYTGTGQTGDQTFENPRNRWLRDAKDGGREIHIFRQHQEGGPHEYLGKFEVQDYDSHKKQVDAAGRQRNVILFTLKLRA